MLGPARNQGDSTLAASAHLLDVLAAGIEADVVPEAERLMKEAKLDGPELDFLMKAQFQEATSSGETDEDARLLQAAPPSRQEWMELWVARQRRGKRSRQALPTFWDGADAALRAWVDETARSQTSEEATLESPDAAVSWLPSDTEEQREFRIAARDSKAVSLLAMRVLELLGSRRPNTQRPESRRVDDELQHVVLRDGPELTGEALISDEGTAIVRVAR